MLSQCDLLINIDKATTRTSMSISIPASSVRRGATQAVQHSLKVGGVTPLTITDYPGKLAAVVFVQGCPWSCAYCHNTHLQPRLQKSPLQWQRVFNLLKKQSGIIDAVVFSGGEPVLDPCLPDAIADVKSLGHEVGLHSSGAYPRQLAALLPRVDWVGLDIKAPFDRYGDVTGVEGSGEAARESLQRLLASGVPHEVRTTVHPNLLAEDDLASLAGTLHDMGVRNYALQLFRPQGCRNRPLKAAALAGYPGKDLLQRLDALFPNFTVRQG